MIYSNNPLQPFCYTCGAPCSKDEMECATCAAARAEAAKKKEPVGWCVCGNPSGVVSSGYCTDCGSIAV